MSRRLLCAACCALLLVAACERREPPPQPVPKNKAEQVRIDADRDNLLNLAHGASVVSRTAEMNLENSAVHAIDGDAVTYWKSPPGGASQTFVFSLPARSRIDQLGVIVTDQPSDVPQKIRFEASDDGIAWREVTTMDTKLTSEPQRVQVAPFEAAYLRIQTIESADWYSFIRSFLATGREIAPPVAPRIGECWTINSLPARFVQRGSSVSGVIAGDPPLLLSGASDGRIVRLMWRRGMMWGRAIFTTDPQRTAITGLRWHEDVRSQNVNDGWFGVPTTTCNDIAVDETTIAAAILERARKWSMYGDDALDTAAALLARAPAQRFLVVAHDQARLDATRKALQSRGADLSRVEFSVIPTKSDTEPQRVIAEAHELHLR